jgi:hypothetical protein
MSPNDLEEGSREKLDFAVVPNIGDECSVVKNDDFSVLKDGSSDI